MDQDNFDPFNFAYIWQNETRQGPDNLKILLNSDFPIILTRQSQSIRELLFFILAKCRHWGKNIYPHRFKTSFPNN